MFFRLNFYTQKILYKDNIKSNIPYYIVVDELQDTSELQLEQIYLLAGKDAKNLYGVGDIKQAIYGFRGGQSHVFFEFENLVNNNRIELFDNYRSHSSIVAFNNQLFTKLFFKTKSFEQIAKSTYSDQEVSPVEILKWDISKEQKTTEWQQEILEFYALVEKIKKINNLYPNETIAVLFRTNSQIKKFSSLMCQENFSFQVQWKISFEEDPLFQVFNTLMLIGQARKNHQEMKSLEQLLRFYFSLVSSKNTIDAFTFFEEWKMFDAYNCFVRLLHQHQIINAYQAPFLETLKEKAAYSRNDFKAYLIWLDSIKNDELLAMWTLPFDASNKLPITLQTIHGSKGLQYDHVLLARISSQTKSGSKSDLIMGEANPYAIKELTFLKNPWKTPSYYYDEASKKKLAKEESNRLFYVACTRAKKTLTISLATNVTAESWGEQVLALGEKLGVLSKRSLDDRYLEIIQNEIRLLPVFESKIYQDWRGQFLKDSKTSSSLKLIPSLSVTSLVEYERCPLKYYFKNILTLDTEIVVTNNTPSLSNSKRGIKTHQLIQDYLQSKINFEMCLESLDGHTAKYFNQHAKNWLQLIKQSTSLGIEVEMRFSWKGNIILGTPDLYFIHKDSLNVWDFKTGHLDEEDLRAYVLQLKWYAYALFQKTRPSSSGIHLKIIALDMENETEYFIKYSELEAELSQWWSQFSNYSTKKLNHCLKCSYQVYCSK